MTKILDSWQDRHELVTHNERVLYSNLGYKYIYENDIPPIPKWRQKRIERHKQKTQVEGAFKAGGITDNRDEWAKENFWRTYKVPPA